MQLKTNKCQEQKKEIKQEFNYQKKFLSQIFECNKQ